MAATKPIERVTLSTQITERIRDDILRGVHEAGAQLHEVELAVAFGVSRGPLREAMQRLVQEGLLVSIPHRGVFVVDLSEDDLEDVFFVRASLEEAAVRRILSQGNRAQVAATLTGIANQMDRAMRAGDDAHGGDLDFAFHRVLVNGAASARLSRTYATVQAETRLCLHRLMGGYRSRVDLAVEHFRLADLIGTAPLDTILDELHRHFGDPAVTLNRARTGTPPVSSDPTNPE